MDSFLENMTSPLPATIALNEKLSLMGVPEYRRAHVISPSSSISSIDDLGEQQCFDMSELVEATKPVDTQLSFPSIEWCNDDETDNTDSVNVSLFPFPAEDEEVLSLGKRSRDDNYTNLSRKKSTASSLSSLSSLSSGPASAALDSKIRSGSWGQLVSNNDFPTFSLGSSVSGEKSCTNKRFGYKKQLKKSSLRRCEGQLCMQKPCTIELERSLRIVL
mmetsp:Transcript_15980/g.22523  ORF Transcript_15980/g.22523 Transcript_15980/m.22523 type:complete len:218 (+) Transcript_15980:359-1012(+)